MKQYHEAAHIHDKNGRVAYFIQDTYVLEEVKDIKHEAADYHSARAALPWIKVDPQKFETLVRRGMMQYLVWENGRIVCQYTDEEHELFKAIKVKGSFVNLAEQHYWEHDTSFKIQHITLAEQGLGLAASACNIASLFGVKILLMAVYGNENAIFNLVKREAELKKFGLVMLHGKSSNHVSIAIPAVESSIKVLNEKIDPIGLLIDTCTLRNSLTGDNVKASHLVKALGNTKYLNLADTLDYMTATSLCKLTDERLKSDAHDQDAPYTNLF